MIKQKIRHILNICLKYIKILIIWAILFTSVAIIKFHVYWISSFHFAAYDIFIIHNNKDIYFKLN